MSSRNRLLQVTLFSSQSVSSTNTYNSQAVNILNLDNIGIQANITSTPSGSFNVQVSIDHSQTADGVVINPGNWINIASSTVSISSGSPSNIYIDLNQLSAPYVRLQYVNSSGSGSFSAFLCGKLV